MLSDCNFLDLFSGIGGFRLGAEWAGLKFKNEFHSDIDDYANKVYAKHFPDSIQLGDITKIDTEELKKYGDKWIITGGFPCQDISCAGKKEGLDGERSGLWFEMWRIIRDLQPRFLFGENVGALSIRGLNRILGSLAEIGYDAEWQDIRASDMGAPHRRERIWIIAYTESIRRRYSWEAKTKDDLQDGVQEIREVGFTAKRGVCYDSWPSAPAGAFRMDDGLSPQLDRIRRRNRNSRIKALGNSIVPQVAYEIFKAL